MRTRLAFLLASMIASIAGLCIGVFVFSHIQVFGLGNPDSIALDERTQPLASPAVPIATPTVYPYRLLADVPSPTIDELFLDRDQLPDRLDPARLRTVLVTGDIIPARYVNYKLTLRDDFTYPFLATLDLLKKADVSFADLEAPLMQRCPISTSGFTFCGDARFLDGLKLAAIDVVSLANNHSFNFGRQGISETVALLSGAGIGITGLDVTHYRDVRGLKTAFLGYNGVIDRFDRELMRRQVSEARRNVGPTGLVIVMPHWGAEYVAVPTTAAGVADDHPREIGRLLIDAGADVVVGNHPHWVQGVEYYQGKLIAYSHGNFIFDQNFSRETREGVLGRYTFYDNKLIAVRYLPTLIDDYTQPRPLAGPEAAAVLKRMRDASNEMVAKPWR